jgi:hypothetical protein
VLSMLKDTKADPDAKTARAKRASKQYARTEQPRSERLTRDNIRRVTTELVATSRRSRAEKERLVAEAHAISIESALVEMSIGLRRAAKAASDLERVAKVIGGMHVDMTPTAKLRLADCRKSYQDIEACMKAIMEAGLNVRIRRLTHDD